MVTIEQPPELPIEAAILILLPYFVAVIAAIIYTNKKIKEGSNNTEKKSKDKEDGNENDITSYFCIGPSWCPSLLFLYSLLPNVQ